MPKQSERERDFDVFCSKALKIIGPPYEPSFVQLFLPLVQNEAIAGTISLRTEEERKCVKEFIGN